MYYKITNRYENHYGYQYNDGLNVLKEKFNDDPTASCVAGGFYFTDIFNILHFIGYGCYLREIELPIDDPDFKIVKDPSGNKWRANKIILGNKYDLFSVETFKYLEKKGADIKPYCNKIFDNVLYLNQNNLDTLKYLMEHGVDINIMHINVAYFEDSNNCMDKIKYLLENGANREKIFMSALQNNHFEIVKFLLEDCIYLYIDKNRSLEYAIQNCNSKIVKCLVKNGADFDFNNDHTLQIIAKNGNLDVIKYFTKKGANIHFNNDYVLQVAAKFGHLSMVKYLITSGADVHANDDYALRWAARKGYIEVVKFLVVSGANIHAYENYALRWATKKNRTNVVKYLVDIGTNDSSC